MDRVQEKYFELLTEIDDICRTNNIMYYLSNRTALCAYVEGEINNQNFNPSIMIDIADCRKFMKAVQDANRPNRVLESMENNGKYPHFTLKYTATDSLMFMVRQRDNYKEHGICVIINLIGYVPKKITGKIAAILRIGWYEAAFPYTRDHASKKVRIARWIMWPLVVLNREVAGKTVFRCLYKIYSRKTKNRQVFLAGIGTKKLKTNWINGYAFNVTIHERVFPLPSEPAAYLTMMYGKNYRNVASVETQPSVYRIVDADISFEEFREKNMDFFEDKEFVRTITKNNKLNDENRKYNDAIENAWNIAMAVETKMKVAKEYDTKRKKRMKNLHDSSAYDELYGELSDYVSSIQKTEKYHIKPYVDEELTQMAVDTLNALGRNVLDKNFKIR